MRLTLTLAMAALAAPLAAQQPVPNPTPAQELPADRGYDKHTAKHDAVDAQEQSTTQALNSGQAGAGAAAAEQAAINQEAYAADKAKYRAAVMANARATAEDQARYERQQIAYADAMAAWRKQKAACEAGDKKGCTRPEPDPATFY